MKTDLIEKLNDLKSKNCFGKAVWESNGLNISPPEICDSLNRDFKLLVNEAIELLSQNTSEKELTKRLSKKLRSIKKGSYDTEEKELFLDKVVELAEMLNINLNFEINRWMYGYILAKLLSFSK